MNVNHLYNFVTMEKSSLTKSKHSSSSTSSLPLFGLIEILFIGFFKWVSFAHIFFSRFLPILQHQQQKCVSDKIKNKDLALLRDDVEMVMKSLGFYTEQESDEQYNFEELSNIFQEKEPSLEEVKQAFDVFDENRDGFIDPIELQRVMTILGLKQGSKLENCRRMIRSFDGNKDERIDFNGFVKFMENSYSAEN
ncbi:unnamed protein product [Cochlearia groenlandica]